MKTPKMLMLALVATTLVVGGCARHHGYGTGSSYREAALERGLAETNELVDRTVKDPEKAKQAKAIVQDIVNEVKQSFKKTSDYHQKRSEEHTSELQSLAYLVCRLLLEKKKKERSLDCINSSFQTDPSYGRHPLN